MNSKHMMLCVAIVVIGAVVLAGSGLSGGYGLFFLIPCMLMMGMMMWMMGGRGSGSGSGKP